MKNSFFSIRIIITLMLLAAVTMAEANNIRIQRIWLSDTNRTAQTVLVNLNLSWEHSWRDSINWDAAWVFFKFREPKDSIWRWRHGNLSKTGNNAGTSTTAMKVVVPDDLKGAFYYRQELGNGSIQASEIKLLWNFGLDGVTNIDSVEIRIFATEMVYVPEGGFCIGDGNGLLSGPQVNPMVGFQLKNAPNNYASINSGWSRVINHPSDLSGFKLSGLQGLDVNLDGIADFPDFPSGYRAFYCMKYEVTQGQYTDFLNTLSLSSSNLSNPMLKRIDPNHALALVKFDPYYNQNPINELRHTIQIDTLQTTKYLVSRPDRALGRADNYSLIGFCEWAGLRPMTELEFEKAARGPLPPFLPSMFGGDVSNERAWGNDRSIPSNDFNGRFIKFSGPETGSEFDPIFDIKRRYAYTTMSWGGGFGAEGGDFQNANPSNSGELKGPIRAGFFATDTTSRISAGASYYGIMDLSYNVTESVISLYGAQSRINFSHKMHGDGIVKDYLTPKLALCEFYSKGDLISKRASEGSTGFLGFRSVRTAPVNE